MTGGWGRDLDTVLLRLRNEFGVQLLVNLLEPHELEELRIAALPDRCRRHVLTHWQLPIPDGGVPADLPAAVGLVRGIVERINKGETVVVRCKGGLGRTGTLTGACCVSLGRSPTEAITAVREARPGASENPAQERCVAAIAKLMDPEPPVR